MRVSKLSYQRFQNNDGGHVTHYVREYGGHQRKHAWDNISKFSDAKANFLHADFSITDSGMRQSEGVDCGLIQRSAASSMAAKSRTLGQIDLNDFECSIHHVPHKAVDIEDGRVVETSANVSDAQTRFSLPIQILTFLSHIPTAPHNKPS
jgi:hypothetical protein